MSTDKSTTMAANETTMGHGVNGDEDVETVAPKATVTSERFVSLDSLDAIPLPSKRFIVWFNFLLILFM